jgi:hypothetical protein
MWILIFESQTLKRASTPINESYGFQSLLSEPRLTRREVGEMIQRTMSQRPSPKYHYINGMYIKIK